ncbi:hypothetical protein PR202_ga14156 [Eleusine coracana subsp. coracana]|uniref:Nucleotide-diphospho-sugar transferase domain-containing protein n=1 Tax=Eleusine coracana subsp. coracana TaxID=191504 RepID=A0AAV5CGE5_ELECO|nr:hypothetical protein PR202_ga14156 [Eleusine coracana subsp. coracana]
MLGGKMKGGEMSSISPLVSFMLGAAMATVCVLFFMSASPGGRRSSTSPPSPPPGTTTTTAPSPSSTRGPTTSCCRRSPTAPTTPPCPRRLLPPSRCTHDSFFSLFLFLSSRILRYLATCLLKLLRRGAIWRRFLQRAATKGQDGDHDADQRGVDETGLTLDLFFESFRMGEGGVARLLEHLVIVTMDPAAYEGCQAVHRHCYFLRTTTGVDYRSEKMFMSKDYLEMMWGRNRFQQTVLELGYNFLFTDVDVMWFRDPFRHISMAADIAISSDVFIGDPYSLAQLPQRRLPLRALLADHHHRLLPRVAARTVEILREARAGRLSKDLNKISTLHANCCVGLGAKMHDLRGVLDVWKNYTAGTPDERRYGKFQWKLPGICIH